MKAFVSCNISDRFEERTGIDALPLRPYRRFDEPVATHADMLICILDNNIFCYSDYRSDNKEIFDLAASEGYNIIECEPPASAKYPYDIGLNVLVIGKRIFARKDSIAKRLYDYAVSHGYEIVDVRQGYACCTTLVLDENNVVTGDISICSALERYGINVLLINEASIRLTGYKYGFIGGSTFVKNNDVFFFGDPDTLDESDRIKGMIKALCMEEISILSGEVFDFGGVKLL